MVYRIFKRHFVFEISFFMSYHFSMSFMSTFSLSFVFVSSTFSFTESDETRDPQRDTAVHFVGHTKHEVAQLTKKARGLTFEYRENGTV